MGAHHPPGLSVAVGAVRADGLHHLPDHPVAQLGVATPCRDAGHLGRGDVAADGLAVHPRQPLDPPQILPASHSRRTSRTSNTRTSLNAIAALPIR